MDLLHKIAIFVRMEKDSLQPDPQPNNPLHGVKLIDILEYLVGKYGWKILGEKSASDVSPITFPGFQFKISKKNRLG